MLKLGLRRTLRRHDCASARCAYRGQNKAVWAGVAQLVEHLICNQRVGGSSPFASSSFTQRRDWIWLYCRAVLAKQNSGDFFKDCDRKFFGGLMGFGMETAR